MKGAANFLSLRRLAFWLAVLAASLALPRALEHAGTPIDGPVSLEGHFPENGRMPPDTSNGAAGLPGASGDPIPGPGTRYWSSWDGEDSNTGSVTIGPFAAPRVLSLRVCGMPRIRQNRLVVENPARHESVALTGTNIGGFWSEVRVTLPSPWRGEPVRLVAEDRAVGAYGWFAFTAPLSVPLWAAAWTGAVRTTGMLLAVGVWAALFLCAGLSVTEGWAWLDRPLRLPVALGLALIAAYTAFWAFVLAPTAGFWVVGALAVAALWLGSRAPGCDRSSERRTLALIATLAVTYVGFTTFYEPDRPFHETAARRFVKDLVADNQIPGAFARHAALGESLRTVVYGIPASERPPLAAGADLMLAGPLWAAGTDFGVASQCAGIWLQLSWVFAATVLLELSGVPPQRLGWAILSLAATGFLIINTVFVWPKLLAATLMITGFLLAVRAEANPEGRRRQGAGAALMALALVTHPSAAFSLLAAVPWLLVGAIRSPRSTLVAAGSAVAILLPWYAWQAHDQAAGDLFKQHLAGATSYDSRTPLQVIRDAYAQTPARDLLQARWVNLKRLFRGPWIAWIIPQSDEYRKVSEYMSVFFALGWWNLGLGMLALKPRGTLLGPVLWALATLAVWIAVMFVPGSTMIHNGSYAAVLTLLSAGAGVLASRSAWLLAAVAAACAVQSAIVWTGFAGGPAPINPAAAAIFGIGLLASVAAAFPAGSRPQKKRPVFPRGARISVRIS